MLSEYLPNILGAKQPIYGTVSHVFKQIIIRVIRVEMLIFLAPTAFEKCKLVLKVVQCFHCFLSCATFYDLNEFLSGKLLFFTKNSIDELFFIHALEDIFKMLITELKVLFIPSYLRLSTTWFLSSLGNVLWTCHQILNLIV